MGRALALVATLAVGALIGGRLPVADAQRTPAACGAPVDQARQQLRAARRAQARAEQAQARAEHDRERATQARAAQQALLDAYRARAERLEAQLQAPPGDKLP